MDTQQTNDELISELANKACECESINGENPCWPCMAKTYLQYPNQFGNSAARILVDVTRLLFENTTLREVVKGCAIEMKKHTTNCGDEAERDDLALFADKLLEATLAPMTKNWNPVKTNLDS